MNSSGPHRAGPPRRSCAPRRLTSGATRRSTTTLNPVRPRNATDSVSKSSRLFRRTTIQYAAISTGQFRSIRAVPTGLQEGISPLASLLFPPTPGRPGRRPGPSRPHWDLQATDDLSAINSAEADIVGPPPEGPCIMAAPLCPHCGSRQSRAVLPSRDPLEYYCLSCHRYWLLPEPGRVIQPRKTDPEKAPRRKRST